jgi:LacI family transcriptional regulator
MMPKTILGCVMPKVRKLGVRFSDIAERAQVGIATVDRVLNERGNVSAKTARRVIEAARALKTNRVLPTPWQRHRRYRAIFSRQRASIAERLNVAFLYAATPWHGSITLERTLVEDDDPEIFHAEIMKCIGVVDGIIIVPVDDPMVRHAVRAAAQKIPIVAMVSDIRKSCHHWFVGVDNYRAGRTAGCLAAKSIPHLGKAVILWRGSADTGQADRVRGFQDVFASRESPVEVLTFPVINETHDNVTLFVSSLFRQHPDLCAIYNAGIDEPAVAEAIRRYRPQDRFCYIAHDLTPANAALLHDHILDFLIDQDLEQQARHALDLLLSYDHLIAPAEIQTAAAFTIHCAESLPPQAK